MSDAEKHIAKIKRALMADTIATYQADALTCSPIPNSWKRIPASPLDREALESLEWLRGNLAA